MREDLCAVKDAATDPDATPILPYRRYYGASGSEVGRARQEMKGQLSFWGLPELSENAVLLLSELFTNAVRHVACPPPGRLRVDAALVREDGWPYLRIGVTDTDRESADRVKAPEPLPDREGGMGLVLVEGLSTRWGVERTDVGKTVWCDFALGSRAA